MFTSAASVFCSIGGLGCGVSGVVWRIKGTAIQRAIWCFYVWSPYILRVAKTSMFDSNMTDTQNVDYSDDGLNEDVVQLLALLATPPPSISIQPSPNSHTWHGQLTNCFVSNFLRAFFCNRSVLWWTICTLHWNYHRQTIGFVKQTRTTVLTLFPRFR